MENRCKEQLLHRFPFETKYGPDCAVTYDLLSRHSQVASEEKIYTESSIKELHARREKEVREELAKRLRPVCQKFSEQDFDKLVREMAERQVRDERRLVW